MTEHDAAKGTLSWEPATARLDLLAEPVRAALDRVAGAEVAPIDPTLADTAAFCAAYDVAADRSANCVIVAGKRGDDIQYAAVMVLATTRADVNGVIRKHLGARKASFAPMDAAVELTGMEYGGITPIGLPQDWPILVDDHVAEAGNVVIGSGLRKSKVLVPASELLTLPLATRLALAR